MIKFPSTISEYTGDKLWKNGVDESIARRILVDFRKLEDQKEIDLRKLYLAHYYCEIGDYHLAMTLAKSILLENKYVDDTCELIKKICVKDRDFENFTKIIKLMEKIYVAKSPISFLGDIEGFDITQIFGDGKDTGKGKIVYNGPTAEYYKNGKLIFSVEDKNCETFMKDSVARHLLGENQPEGAIALLADVNLSKLKNQIRIYCHQTLLKAHCMLENFDEAYEYCEFLMENDVYMSDMADIFFHLYKTNSPNFEKLKEFLQNFKGYDSFELGDMHSLAKDIEDESFWDKIYANNPIDPSGKSEDTYLLKGVLAFNKQDYALADKLLKQSTAIYGHFGKSWFFRYYIELYNKKLKRSPIIDDMPAQLYTARVDELYGFIDKKLQSKLKKCRRRSDFVKNADDNLLELDVILSGVFTKIYDIVDIVNRVYKMNYLPACELVKKIIVDDEYNIFMRSICLANYMMYSKKNKFTIGKEVYDNPLISMFRSDVDERIEPLAYGIAIYLALGIYQGVDNADLKQESVFLKTICKRVMNDYSEIAPLAVFGVLIAFFSEEKVQYIKDAVRKREVKEFAQAILEDTGWSMGWYRSELDVQIDEFLTFCKQFDKK